MKTPRDLLRHLTAFAVITLLLVEVIQPRLALSQFNFKQKATEMLLCGGGAFAGFKLGEKLADSAAQKMKLPPGLAADQKRKFEIGLAMALCNGGKLVANTTFATLSKKDREARQSDLDAAVASEEPVTKNVALPDHPKMTETITTEATVTDGDRECKVVKDHLAEGDKGDDALVKYCHKPPSGKYALVTGI